MASSKYSNELGAILVSACRDFGVRLIKSWEADSGKPLDRTEIEEFVNEAIKNFFGGEGTKADDLETETETHEAAPLKAVKKKKKAPAAKSKKKAEEAEEPGAEEPKKKTSSTTAKKPKCQATTAKGTKCTKCAVGDGPFCNIHAKKKKEAEDGGGGESSTKTGGGKGGKGLSRGGGGKGGKKKKCEKPAEPEPEEEEEKLADEPVFTVPEYEVEPEPEEEEPDNVEMDPDFVPAVMGLLEDDFDETTDEDEEEDM